MTNSCTESGNEFPLNEVGLDSSRNRCYVILAYSSDYSTNREPTGAMTVVNFDKRNNKLGELSCFEIEVFQVE